MRLYVCHQMDVYMCVTHMDVHMLSLHTELANRLANGPLLASLARYLTV